MAGQDVVDADVAIVKLDQGSSPSAGFYVIGEYLGMRPAGTWTPDGETEAQPTKPQIGIATGENRTVRIKVVNEVTLGQAVAGLVKGDFVAVPVRPRPPFGSRGAVQYQLDAGGDEGNGTWK